MSRTNNSEELPEAVYAEIVTSLYNIVIPMIVAGVTLTGVGVIAALRTTDPLIAPIPVAFLIITIVRLWLIHAFHIAARRPLDRTALAKWESRYIYLNYVFATSIGIFVFRCAMLDDMTVTMMANVAALGYIAGFIARGSVPQKYSAVTAMLVCIPMVAANLLQFDMVHLAMAATMTMYTIGGLTICRTSYGMLSSQLILKQQFADLARLDPLTGLLNRGALRSDLEKLTAKDIFAVHSIDLDRFKAANDRFGHPAGDAILKIVAARLTGLTRHGDLIVRMGGDEFIVVQTRIDGRGDAERLADRIVRELGRPYFIDGTSIDIGASVGIALADGSGTTEADALLAQSDRALYAAKQTRNNFAFVESPALVPDIFGAEENGTKLHQRTAV